MAWDPAQGAGVSEFLDGKQIDSGNALGEEIPST